VYNDCIPPGVILAVKGDPGMCSSANLTLILYSPGSVGRYDAEQVPSELSTQFSWALEGPSIDRDRPPINRQQVLKVTVTSMTNINAKKHTISVKKTDSNLQLQVNF